MRTNSVQQCSASFARPANTTTYASADLVANNATAGSVEALQFAAGPAGTIRRARLAKSSATVANASFRLHLFASDPCATAPSNGDNGAIELNAGSDAYLGYVDFASPPDIWAAQSANFVDVGFHWEGGAIHGILEARAAYVPASAETFTVTLETEPA